MASSPLCARPREETPGNARTRIRLASAYEQAWAMDNHNPYAAREAARWAVLAQQANPEGREGYLTELELRARFANLYLRLQDNLANEVKKKKATEEDRKRIQAKLQSDLQEQRVLIVTVLQRCVDLDPTDAPLR